MNPTIGIRYLCPHCLDEHEDRDDAATCCDLEIEKSVFWICTLCEGKHHDQNEALHCCCDEEGFLLITPAQLEAAGQQRLLP